MVILWETVAGQALASRRQGAGDAQSAARQNTGNGVAVYSFDEGTIAPERIIPIPLQKLAGSRRTKLIRDADGTMGVPYPAAIAILGETGSEKPFHAPFLHVSQRGTGNGALATVNSFGDLLSSIVVGLLWHRVSYTAGLSYAATLTLLGAVLLFLWKPRAVDTNPF